MVLLQRGLRYSKHSFTSSSLCTSPVMSSMLSVLYKNFVTRMTRSSRPMPVRPVPNGVTCLAEMPLVVLSGFPCSGKTRRANELIEYLKTHVPGVLVHMLTDELTASKDICYTDSTREKTIRASLKSEVERLLNSECVVIVDSLNYIKGYRYELYCVSKHLQTTHCVILCDTPVEAIREWNSAREPVESYSSEVLDALVARFEPPDSRNRWDYPLFNLFPDDPFPGQAICNALFDRKAPPPNQSTQSQPLSEASFLHELDRVTQDVVRNIIAAQKTCVPGEQIPVPNCSDKVELPRLVTMAELRRARKQFISYTKSHPAINSSSITSLFIQYLNRTII